MAVRLRSAVKSALFRSPKEVNPLFHIFIKLFNQTVFSRSVKKKRVLTWAQFQEKTVTNKNTYNKCFLFDNFLEY